MKELRERQQYIKPSEIRRNKIIKAIYKERIKINKHDL